MTSNTATLAAPRNGYMQAMMMMGMLYFIFGFVTWLNGSLIPFLQLACDLSTSQALLVTFAFYMAYLFLSLPSSFILNKTGFKNGMAVGLGVMAIGSLIFIPAANSRNFSLFLTGLFVQGAGLSLLQTAVNPYVSILGPIESAAKRISIMGICNKIAGAISPLVLSSILLKNAEALEKTIATVTDKGEKARLLDELASRVVGPYIVIAIVLVLLAIFISRSTLPEIDTNAEEEVKDTNVVRKNSVFAFPHLLLGVLCLFLYVGVEVMAGDVIGTYGKALGMSLDKTKYFTTFTMIAMLAGYIIGIATIPKFLSQHRALLISAVLGVVFTIGAYLTSSFTAVTFIALLGLANALMWPAIFPLAISGLGRFTKIGSALLIMGIFGGAVLPQIYTGLFEAKRDGLLSFLYSPSVDFRHAFLYCMLPCYIYIFYYAVAGYKVGKAKA